ncbi:uncharacterized protein G2W53_028513 [Senna tora]|uniref:Uncharacterized protein n=1 Tax=Senna tora TaxID=362788 RepID=A0A834TCG5_9FABA|nr:uncharacterized protein G2W53_028513 [Senna tora]
MSPPLLAACQPAVALKAGSSSLTLAFRVKTFFSTVGLASILVCFVIFSSTTILRCLFSYSSVVLLRTQGTTIIISINNSVSSGANSAITSSTILPQENPLALSSLLFLITDEVNIDVNLCATIIAAAAESEEDEFLAFDQSSSSPLTNASERADASAPLPLFLAAVEAISFSYHLMLGEQLDSPPSERKLDRESLPSEFSIQKCAFGRDEGIGYGTMLMFLT